MMKYAALSLLLPAVVGGAPRPIALPVQTSAGMTTDVCPGEWSFLVRAEDDGTSSWNYVCTTKTGKKKTNMDISTIHPEGRATTLTQLPLTDEMAVVQIAMPCGEANEMCTALGYPSWSDTMKTTVFKAVQCQVWFVNRNGYAMAKMIIDNETLGTCHRAIERHMQFQHNIMLTDWIAPRPEDTWIVPMYTKPEPNSRL